MMMNSQPIYVTSGFGIDINTVSPNCSGEFGEMYFVIILVNHKQIRFTLFSNISVVYWGGGGGEGLFSYFLPEQ